MANFYVSTSIPYVNADPHIGFAMELMYGDVLARYARLRGDKTIYSTGTDEHGGKIAEKATEAGISPQQYADNISARFYSLTKVLNISTDRFVRTTDKNHEQRAQLVWSSLEKYIYKSSYSGWYCTGDEAFFTQTEVDAAGGVCPAHNRPFEKVEEENYFFKLSAFSGQVKEKIESEEFKIIPQTRRNEIFNLLNRGLEDISISRPKDKISWGIPVPKDKNQVMYVWFEALLNYITVLGYPEHADFKTYWPADYQVIGKDIIRFHAAIWPAILLALELPLPKVLYVHGFVTSEGKKMSKSLGNVINPFEVVDQYGVDAFRYYMLRHVPSYDDGDFSWDKFSAAYNNELANELGNLVQRAIAMSLRYFDGRLGELPPPAHDTAAYEQAITDCHFDLALEDVWQQIRGLNQYIETEKPWAVAKEGDNEHLLEILRYVVGSVGEIAVLLKPFLPDTAERIAAALSGEQLQPIEGTLFPRHDTKAS